MKPCLTVAGYLIDKGKVLLIHHKKLGMWLPPGGHIDDGEVPDDALVREFKEETNIDIEILGTNEVPMGGDILRQLAVPFYVNIHKAGSHEHLCFFYVCKSKNPGALRINRDEVNDAQWFSLEDLEKEDISPDITAVVSKAFETYAKVK